MCTAVRSDWVVVFLRRACAIAAAGRRREKLSGVCSRSPKTGALTIHLTPSDPPSASSTPSANGRGRERAGQRRQYFAGFGCRYNCEIGRYTAPCQSLSTSAQEKLHDNQCADPG